jgi:carbamoyl-phosphate synthase large subunit
VRDVDKPRVLGTAKLLAALGFKIFGTGGTARYLAGEGVPAQRINKVSEGRPHVVDAIKNGGIQLVLNTTEGKQALADSRSLRRAALLHKVPYYTTLAGAIAASEGIKAYLAGDLEVRALQDYFG